MIKKLGARTRNPADIGLIMDLEQERLVGHTRFQALDPCNLGLRNMKDLGDQFHRDIVGMILVALIEKAELLKVLELVHLVVRLFVDIHFRHREVMLAREDGCRPRRLRGLREPVPSTSAPFPGV